MPEYEIKCVVKDKEDVIKKIGYEKDGKVYVITREEAVERINKKTASYYVYKDTKVHIYAKDFLRSTADKTTYNNLDNLRHCK